MKPKLKTQMENYFKKTIITLKILRNIAEFTLVGIVEIELE